MLSLTKLQNPETAVNKLLKDLSINIPPDTIAAELDRHPDYPSLLAISDVLSAFHIENAAYRVESDKLASVPCPFIAHTYTNNGDFIVVHKIVGEQVTVSNESWNKHKITIDAFRKLFKGVVLTAERSPGYTVPGGAAQSPFVTFLNSVKVPAIITGLVFIPAAALLRNGYFTGLNWQTAVLALVKTAGLITAVLLLVQSIDGNNPLIKKLCETTTKVNCNAILSSKAAKVFEWLTWSEVGFFYFAGTWLLLFFGGSTGVVWAVLAILNVLSLPYTFYSIYHQARVAKQWCVLCCTVQALLWLEFIPLATIYKYAFTQVEVTAGSVGIIITCLILPVILWVVLKPLFLKLQQLRPLKQQLHSFKYNTDLFTSTLTAQPKYAIPPEEWSIVLGNVEANNIITMVSNPYCGPCSKAHKQLMELLVQTGAVQARIVFTADNTDTDIKTPVARHLMALNELPDKTIVENALHDWYEQKQKDYQAWAKVYPVQLNEANFHKLEKQNAWCKIAEVTATPTTLLNGYRLPDLYQLPDLKYMLE